MRRSSPARRILLTGASGYLGSLIAAVLLRHEDVDLVVPVRAGHDLGSLIRSVRAGLGAACGEFDDSLADRVHPVPLPAFEALQELDHAAREFRVDEVIHCAGCLDYHDRPTLEAVNVHFTRRLVELGQSWNLRRFIHISTAFSSGYVNSAVPERLHAEPASDPTDYTRTKRHAERIVAQSGLPYLILRPSIVIGDSCEGHYHGKHFGIYQLWSGMERLLCREWTPEIHLAAPRQPLSLLHQDAFQQIFLAAFRRLPDNSILNIVSEHDRLPDIRALWQLWIVACLRPRTVYFYQRVSDLPVRSLSPQQRALLSLASINIEIVTHPWRFETQNLRRLQQEGLEFAETTLETVAVCQDRFIHQSARIRDFLNQSRTHMAENTEFVHVTSTEGFRPSCPEQSVPGNATG